jgi:uncharacterized protein YcbX
VRAGFLETDGLLGDRALALLDVERNTLVFASNVRDFPTLLEHHARFVDQPVPGRPLPPVVIASPTGETVRSEAPDAHQVLSRWLGRSVQLVSTPPAGYLEGRARFMAGIGCEDPGRVAPLQDACPLSMITTSTLASLAAAAPDAVFDVRRFRMNVLLDVAEPGFPENRWVGTVMALGTGAEVRVVVPDPRCVVTTLAVADLPRDPRILRTVAQANMLPVGPSGPLPCAGVYAAVVTPGVLRTGDSITIAS